MHTLPQLTSVSQISNLPAHNPKGRPQHFVHLSLKSANKYEGRLRYQLRSPQSLQSAMELSEHLGRCRAGEDLMTRHMQAPQSLESAFGPLSGSGAPTTGARSEDRRAPQVLKGAYLVWRAPQPHGLRLRDWERLNPRRCLGAWRGSGNSAHIVRQDTEGRFRAWKAPRILDWLVYLRSWKAPKRLGGCPVHRCATFYLSRDRLKYLEGATDIGGRPRSRRMPGNLERMR